MTISVEKCVAWLEGEKPFFGSDIGFMLEAIQQKLLAANEIASAIDMFGIENAENISDRIALREAMEKWEKA